MKTIQAFLGIFALVLLFDNVSSIVVTPEILGAPLPISIRYTVPAWTAEHTIAGSGGVGLPPAFANGDSFEILFPFYGSTHGDREVMECTFTSSTTINCDPSWDDAQELTNGDGGLGISIQSDQISIEWGIKNSITFDLDKFDMCSNQGEFGYDTWECTCFNEPENRLGNCKKNFEIKVNGAFKVNKNNGKWKFPLGIFNYDLSCFKNFQCRLTDEADDSVEATWNTDKKVVNLLTPSELPCTRKYELCCDRPAHDSETLKKCYTVSRKTKNPTRQYTPTGSDPFAVTINNKVLYQYKNGNDRIQVTFKKVEPVNGNFNNPAKRNIRLRIREGSNTLATKMTEVSATGGTNLKIVWNGNNDIDCSPGKVYRACVDRPDVAGESFDACFKFQLSLNLAGGSDGDE